MGFKPMTLRDVDNCLVTIVNNKTIKLFCLILRTETHLRNKQMLILLIFNL